MHLSLTRHCSWTLFLMLVSSLLLWENVASAVAKSNSGKPPLLMDTFKQAIKLSKEMNQRIRVVSDNFNQFYTQGRGFERRNATSCHTDPLGIPENKDQASQIQPEVLLKGLQSLLSAWIEPLSHLWSLMLNKLGYTPPMLTRVMEVKEKNAKILESIRKILDQVNIGTGGNEGYLPWSGLASLQAANRDTRYFAFYNLFRCLKRDSSHVELYLRYLQCKSVQGSGC
uniref:Prolactin family 4, subfamily a, member 1 n=1 Tax=Nannospalax galili TaxID=1026970 RepID=A0A8C6QH42_NANGA